MDPSYHFYDSSIRPVKYTDLNGNIKRIRTYGLTHYNHPDFIMTDHFEDYEMIFYAIIDRIFALRFDIKDGVVYNGKHYIFESVDEKLSRIVLVKEKRTGVLTYVDPVSCAPDIYCSMGLEELYDHCEFEIDASIPESKEMIIYLIDEVKEGIRYDEECVVYVEDYMYSMETIRDQFGKAKLKVNFEVIEKSNNREKEERIRRIK